MMIVNNNWYNNITSKKKTVLSKQSTVDVARENDFEYRKASCQLFKNAMSLQHVDDDGSYEFEKYKKYKIIFLYEKVTLRNILMLKAMSVDKDSVDTKLDTGM